MSNVFNIYPQSVHDVYKKVPQTFSASIDKACNDIYGACKGLGTDEKTLIKVLGPISPNERSLIAYRYKDMFGQVLKDVMSSEAGGDFGYLLQLITVPLPEAEAYVLHQACKGMGTVERDLWPVLMARTNEEMAILRKAFFERFNKDLAVLLADEVGGDLKKVLMAALQAPMVEYNRSFHTEAKAVEEAEKLYKAGVGKWGTDEETFIKTLLSSPPNFLALVNAVYSQKYGHDIQAAVKKEFSGDAEKALLHFVRLSLEPGEFLAEHFEGTMKGMGTDERGLSAAVVRYHAYLPAIKNEYSVKYGKSLKDRIKGETSGDYQELLLALLNAPSAPIA